MSSRLRVLLLSVPSVLALAAVLTLSHPAVADHRSPSISKPAANRKADPPPGIDLDVTFISRTPLYKAYCVQYMGDVPNQPGRPFLCPGTQYDRRWPEPGEVVTFTAYVVNKGTITSPAFGYVWHIDGAEVASGMLPALAPAAGGMSPNFTITATYQWRWAHTLSPDGQRALGDHTVRFSVDPGDAIAETYESNNSLEDRTNAMSFSIYITQEMYEAYNVPVDPKYPYSAEDWLQKQIAAMNRAFERSVYPVTPQGSALRVRINAIGITPTDPGSDGQHDGGWFLRGDVRCSDCGYYDPSVDIDWGLVHELSHQVSLIDLYAIGVYAANVFVQDRNGLPSNSGFGWRGGGLMFGGSTAPHDDPHLYESHSAGGASTFAGYRNGYYGSYLYDIPLQNTLRVLDNQGNPASGVAVSLYQRSGPWDWIGHMGVDNTPEISGATDGDGVFHLPNRSANGGAVTANGHVLHDNPFGVVDIVGNQGLFLIRLTKDQHEEFHWLDITQFNLAYWLGDTISHTFTISSHVPPAGAPLAPKLLVPRVEGTWAKLSWQPSPSQGVIGYYAYRATPPMYNYVAASDLLTDTHFEEEFGVPYDQHRTYAITAVGGDGLESGFSEFVYVPGIAVPVAVAVGMYPNSAAPDGARVVLNNGDLYPLLRQQPDGRYTHRLVNVHYDLGNAHSLTHDPGGRLLVSGFGASPDGRRAVRVYDEEMQPLWAFGEEGSAPGQFAAPAGVALWGPPYTYGGPYGADEHALLLLPFDGSYAGAQGEAGTAVGASFVQGKHGQGVLVDGDDSLSYPTAGNISRLQGAIEFWVRPNWNGNDGQNHLFLEMGQEWNNGLRLYKEGTSRLRFLLWDCTAEYGIDHIVDDWKAGEWRHIAVTWKSPEVALYIDGRRVAIRSDAGVPDELPQRLSIGSNQSWSGQRADAVIDELRISDVPRLGNSETCSRILVADSVHHRIQAFDMLGSFLAGFGSLGSGTGQLNTPQGVAVDRDGRVIVADQGNHRLVMLSFDGREFGHLNSLDLGLHAPTGVAVDAWGHMVFADTLNNQIVVFDPEEHLVIEYAEPNDGYTGPFSAPRGVAVEPDGDLVVADTGNRRVVTIHRLPGKHRVCLPTVSSRLAACTTLHAIRQPEKALGTCLLRGSPSGTAAVGPAIAVRPRARRAGHANAADGLRRGNRGHFVRYRRALRWLRSRPLGRSPVQGKRRRCDNARATCTSTDRAL